MIPDDVAVMGPPMSPFLRNSNRVEAAYGAMLKRGVLEARADWAAFSFPPCNYFLDANEAEAKMAYGLHYEHLYSEELLKGLARGNHKFGFMSLGNKEDGKPIQIVVIRVDKKSIPDRYRINENVEQLKVQDGTVLEASFKVPNVGNRPIEANLHVMENLWAIHPGPGHVICYVMGNSIPTDDFAEMSRQYPEQPTKFFDDKFMAKENTAGHRRASNAVHELWAVADDSKPKERRAQGRNTKAFKMVGSCTKSLAESPGGMLTDLDVPSFIGVDP